MVAKDSAELHLHVFQGGRHRGQVGDLQVDSLQAQESFIRRLTGGHPGYEAQQADQNSCSTSSVSLP